MDMRNLTGLISEVKTPAYIFDADEFAQRAWLVREQFGDRTSLCYSIKANPFLLLCLPDVFERVEVCSPGELEVCKRAGIPAPMILLSGVSKTEEDIARAMEYGVGTFTAESLFQAKLIHKCASQRGKRVSVLVRVACGSQFGLDEQEVLSLFRNRAEYPGIEFAGLHYFTGTQKRRPETIEKELDHIAGFADRIGRETGCMPACIEYGTGLAVDYFRENADTLEQERLAAAAAKVREVAGRYELTVEMGRFFAAPCGYYLTRVMETKTSGDICYAILDGGLHQLKYDGQLQGMKLPRILHIKDSRKDSEGIRNTGGSVGYDGVKVQDAQNSGIPEGSVPGPAKWTLAGSLCTTADILARDAQFDSLKAGDLLVFCRTGAYSVTEGMAVFLSRELPAVWLYSQEGGLRQLRRHISTAWLNLPDALRPGCSRGTEAVYPGRDRVL